MHRGLNLTALVLVIAGAITWGLIGIADFNPIAAVFGAIVWLERVIYALIGLAGVYMIYYGARVEVKHTSRKRVHNY